MYKNKSMDARDKPGNREYYPKLPPWPPPSSETMADTVDPPLMTDKNLFADDAVERFEDSRQFAVQRWNSARRQMADGDFNGLGVAAGKGIRNHAEATARTLAAWLLTPREAFIPESFRSDSYRPVALPLESGQTISAPYMVSRMSAVVNPNTNMKVLEIGTGSGYQAAVLASLSNKVFTIETVGPLAAKAAQNLDSLSKNRPWLKKIRLRTGNGYHGWVEEAPFDRIIVTCAINHLPPALLEQLAPEGFMILPLGPAHFQYMLAVRQRKGETPNAADSSWLPAIETLDNLDLPTGKDRSKLENYEVSNVYRNGTRVVFVPFVY